MFHALSNRDFIDPRMAYREPKLTRWMTRDDSALMDPPDFLQVPVEEVADRGRSVVERLERGIKGCNRSGRKGAAPVIPGDRSDAEWVAHQEGGDEQPEDVPGYGFGRFLWRFLVGFHGWSVRPIAID